VAGKLKVLMDQCLRGQPAAHQHASRRQSGLRHFRSANIGDFSSGDADVPVVLVRVTDPSAGKIWLFSAETLSKVPELYDNVEAHQVESKLPQSLVRNVFLGMPLWQWLALLARDSGGLAIGWVIVLLLAIPRRLWLKFRIAPTCIPTAACPSRCWLHSAR
jgi:hypothetical protein